MPIVNYPGNPTASESPSPPPGSNYSTVVALPADDVSGATWAAVQQPLKTLADRAAFQQKSSNAFLPQTPTSGSGYSAVSHTGSGTGTVAPSGSVSITAGVYFAVKIILGGAVGTATFQSSLDGGVTYGATQTTAASMTDATTGVTLAFAGTFTATDVYQWTSAFTPQAQWKDSAGNVRYLIDHNGYPAGRRTEFREGWFGGAFNYATAGIVPGLPLWQVYAANAPTGFSTGPIFGGISYPSSMAQIDPAQANAGKLAISTGAGLVLQTYSAFIMEWEAALNTVGANNQTFFVGIGAEATGSDPMVATSALAFRKTSAQTNWQAYTGSGTAQTSTDTGVAPVANTLQRFRIAYYGSATPIGIAQGSAVALFWINEALVAAVTATLPTAGGTAARDELCFGLGALNTAGLGAAQPMVVSPLYATWNRALSLAAL